MWNPIICEEKERIYIHNKIEDIYIYLTKRINKIKEFDLYMGKSGIGLFFTYYQIINNQRKNITENVVVSLVDNATKSKIKNFKDIISFAEMAWFICHLHERKLIYIDVNDYFSDIDEALNEAMILLLNEKEYGCINGAISIGLYFYYRYILGSEKCKFFLENLVDEFQKTAIQQDKTINWISIIDYETYEQGYNLGIAHGIPGIMLFLRKLFLVNIKKDAISDMLIRASNFLLQQKHSLNTNKFFFYSACTDSYGYNMKQGWCYGDLSVGYTLFLVSSLEGIERQIIKESALDIIVNTTKRTNLSDIGVIDASLCHGTSGIAHIYNRLYCQTNESEFRNAALYWYKETIKMAIDDKEYAGYILLNYSSEDEKELLDLQNLSFITGIAGIGLSLLSAIYPIEPSWDACLLLS